MQGEGWLAEEKFRNIVAGPAGAPACLPASGVLYFSFMMAKAGLTGVRNGLWRMIPAEAETYIELILSLRQRWENVGQVFSLCWDLLKEGDLFPASLHWERDVTAIFCSQLHPESASETTTGMFTDRHHRQCHFRKEVQNFSPQVCKI